MSAAAISALERGSRHAPYRSSVDLLADALNVATDEREKLHALAASRRRSRALPSEAGGAAAPAPLPRWLNRLVARENELDEITRLVRCRQLVTVAGTGGAGKTRLSVAAAERLASDFPDSVYYVELSQIGDGSHVAAFFANALGLRDARIKDLDIIRSRLRSHRALVVLDNCEHVVGAVAELVQYLLSGTTSVHFLATSRQPLHVDGEAVFILPALSCDDAVSLFKERTRDSGASWTKEPPGSAVEDLCVALDGLPLAIELAAAQTRHLSVEEISKTLIHNPKLLRNSSVSHPERHRTIDATIRWSYELLDDAEKRLFRLLGAFPVDWSLESLSFVFGDDDDASEFISIHASLIDRSFVNVIPSESGRRYGYLETIRVFARDALHAEGEFDTAYNALTAFATSVVKRCAAALGTFSESSSLAELDREYPAIRSAFDYARTRDGLTMVSHELVQRLCDYWAIRGEFSNGLELISAVMRGPHTSIADDVVDATQLAFGQLMRTSGRAAEAYVTDSIVRQRTLSRGSTYLAARALANLASDEFDLGKPETAYDLYVNATAELLPFGESTYSVKMLHGAAIASALLGCFDRADTLLNEAQSAASIIGDRRGLAWVALRRAFVAYRRGDSAESERQYQEGFRILQALGDRPAIAGCFEAIGAKRAVEKNYAEAARAFREGIDFAHRFGLVLNMVSMSERLAHIAFLQGRIASAVSLFSLAAAKRRQFSRAMEARTQQEMSELIKLADNESRALSEDASLEQFMKEASAVADAID